MITLEDIFEMYQDVFEKSTSSILSEDDEVVGACLFEDFISGAHSYLHPETVQRLYGNNLIRKEKMGKSLQLRNMAKEIDARGEWSVKRVRTSDFWKNLMKLSDVINSMKKTKLMLYRRK